MNESIKLISHKPLEDYVTVLAIYDEPSPLSATFTNNSAEKHVFLRNINKKSRQSSTTSSQNFTGNCVKKPHTENEIVEITELNNPPTNGLQVLFDPKEKSETNAITLQKPANSMAHTRSISVDRISEQSTLSRNCARKSRFTDAFLDAKERLTQELERGASISAPGGSSSNYRHSKIVLSSDTKNMTIGVEVTGVPDPESPGRILAIEIIRIDEGGRISEDGRLRVGDQITAINGHLCKEMSLAKARRCLHDLDTLAEPSLAFNRQIQRHASETSSANANIRPVRSALQQANTSMIGVTTSVTIYKSKDGSFGFSFAGRMNAFGEHIYRVSRLMPNGASIGCLEIGDRLLKLDELDLAHCEQADVREYLKSKKSGEFITMTISRDAVSSATSSANRASLESEQQVPNESFSTKPRQLLQRRSDKSLTNLSHSSAVSAEKEGASMRSDYDEHNVERRTLDASELAAMEAHVIADGQELVELDVALNDSPSAGLGISLKAQKIYNDSETIDTGLYIRKLLHGSAAFKDGRLQVDDRLVAIENVNLLKFELNAKALEAFTNCLLQMPSTANYVRLIIARKTPNSTQNTFDARKKEFVKFNGNISDCVTDFINEVKDESESEASVVPDASEAFVRDIVTRKSISEKRPLGAHNDPSHLQTYQRIKHFRQTSAPALVCNGALLRSARTTIDSSDTGVAARVAEPLASEFLRPNRRRSVGTTNSAAVKRRLSFAPTAHNTQLVEAANAKRLITSTSLASSNASPIALARAKLLAQRRPFTVYCDSNNNCDDIANDFDNDDVKIQAEEFSPLSFESKTSPLKSKNGVDSFKKSSKFFNFFKLSGSSLKKMANTTTDDSKENEIDASPGRRSISVEPIEVDGPNYDSRANHLVRSFAGHTKSREQSAQKRNQNITSAVNSKISTSISQPTLATKAPSKDSENAKFHLRVKDDFTSNLEKLEKRNRRKSTGSGLLKLFQRSDTASLHLYAEDEKQAAKYYNIIEEKKRLDAVDDSFRHKYGLIDRNYGSPNMGRRAPPPSYHRIMTDEHDGKGVRDASRSYAVAPNFVSTPPMPPLHRRGHSEHVDIPTKHDAYINQTNRTNNETFENVNIHASHHYQNSVDKSRAVQGFYEYRNLPDYDNTAFSTRELNDKSVSHLNTIKRWNDTHAFNETIEICDGTAQRSQLTNQYCNMKNIVTSEPTSSQTLKLQESESNPIITALVNPTATICHHPQHTSCRHMDPQRHIITTPISHQSDWIYKDSSQAIPFTQVTMDGQIMPSSPRMPPPYEIITMTRSTCGLPIANLLQNTIISTANNERMEEKKPLRMGVEYQNLNCGEANLRPRSTENFVHAQCLQKASIFQTSKVRCEVENSLKSETTLRKTPQSHSFQNPKTTQLHNLIQLLMNDNCPASSQQELSKEYKLKSGSSSKKFQCLIDSNGDETTCISYSTGSNVTNISLDSPNGFNFNPASKNKKLGNVSFNTMAHRSNVNTNSNFPRNHSQSLNYRSRSKNRHTITVHNSPFSRAYYNDQTAFFTNQSSNNIQRYARTLPQLEAPCPTTISRESSSRSRKKKYKMRREVASAVFYDDCHNF